MAPLVMSTNEPVAAGALSARLSALPPSGTLAVGEQVKVLRAQGRAIFNLSGGAPDPTAPIDLAGIAAITADENGLGDPRGELPLRQGLAQRLAGVAVTSGDAFGAAGQGHIRINLVGPLPGILAGTRKLLEALPS